MNIRHGIGALGCALLGSLALGAREARAGTVGVALPQGQLVAQESAEPLRQNVLEQLHLRSVDAVALTSASGAAADAEAQAKHCDYVLYTRLEKKQAGGVMGKLGALGKMAPMVGALSLAGLGGRSAGSAMASAAMQQTAATAASSAAQQQMMGGSAAAGLKQGDTVTLDYRLIAVGSTNPLKAESFSGTAGSDGQDIVTPLVAQAAGAVSGVARSGAPGVGSPAGTASGAAGAASAMPTSMTESAPPSATPPAHSSALGSLFGHHAAPKPAGTAGNDGMDCSKIAAMSNAPGATVTPVSFTDCQKMQAAQQSYTSAASQGTRPGDEQMSCEQIQAELHQQQYSAPDPNKVAGLQATTQQTVADVQRGEALATKMQAEDQTVVNAASAADRATEAASMGMVRGRALETAEKGIQQRHDEANAQFLKETTPNQQKQYSQMADFSADAAGEMQSNPRLARLIQLGNAKRCKGS